MVSDMVNAKLSQRPWKKLRVVVEVTVPPASRATEKDLKYRLEQELPRCMALPRLDHPQAVFPNLRFKTWAAFFPMARGKWKRGEKI